MTIALLFKRISLGLLSLLFAFVTQINAAQISGVLELGDAYIGLTRNKEVVLFEATDALPIQRGITRTDENGAFVIESEVDATAGIFYLQATLRPRVKFITVLGDALPATATVNELTTVAGAYSMAQFLRTGVIIGDTFSLNIAAAMNNNLVNTVTGKSSAVLLNSPNADQTNSWRMTHSLANLTNRCAINPYIINAFLWQTKIDGQRAPQDTLTAMANLARNPGQNADRIYRLSQFRKVFEPALEDEPDAWCVTVKVNNTGDNDFLFSGPANVTFDAWGYAWVTNNTVQGTPNSSEFIVALKPDGSPADGANGTPNSPIFGGGLLGGGWGVSVDSKDQVWAANFGWGGEDYWPDLLPIGDNTGSVTVLNAEDGSIISEPNGLFGDVWRAQAVKHDTDDNIWIASFQNDKIVVWPEGDPNQSQQIFQYNGSGPFGLAINPDGSVWYSNSGGLTGASESSVGKVALVDGTLETIIPPFAIGQTLKVIVSDSMGNAWVASQGNDTVYAIDPNGDVLGAYKGGGIYGPWGLAVDGEDNIWISNFGPLTINNQYGPGRISKICGANPDTWPHNMRMGDPISPDSGYTVLSAGEEVLLANGEPLYGDLPLKSYTPMMRQTSLQIDAAGNVWTINNWKPDSDVDFTVDPGGDGIVIYVGIAPPPNI